MTYFYKALKKYNRSVFFSSTTFSDGLPLIHSLPFRNSKKYDLSLYLSHMMVASHAGDFRGARISSLPTRDEIRASLKTPAWEANMMVERVNRSLRCYSRGSDFFFSKKIIFVTKCRIQNHVICRFLLYMLLFWKKKKM